jgi:hypothetical protein
VVRLAQRESASAQSSLEHRPALLSAALPVAAAAVVAAAAAAVVVVEKG